jgi:hypothetical protein
MSYESETKHGVVYFDPHKGFIQIRNRYFNLKDALRDHPNIILETGHFISSLGDSKNNIQLMKIKPTDLKDAINIEEVGLNNIPQAYQDENGSWWCKIERKCPTCGKEY